MESLKSKTAQALIGRIPLYLLFQALLNTRQLFALKEKASSFGNICVAYMSVVSDSRLLPWREDS